MTLEKLLKDKQIIAVVCNQYGDTGKGKFSDFFASQWADVIARGTGGPNAGHTVIINNRKKIFHLIPAGITYDCRGKINILGNGMVIDIKSLGEELAELDRERASYNNLKISEDAHIIMPYHIALDSATDKSQERGGIGTTGRGVGPCYADKIARRGITVRDIYDKDKISTKMKKAKKFYPIELFNLQQVKDAEKQAYENLFNPEKYLCDIEEIKNKILFMIGDTVSFMHHYIKHEYKICLEGAQGLMLSVEHGLHPYVTSSDCSINGTATGVGISARAIDQVFGIVKFPFMTRVGGGPFPTELGGQKSEEYCRNDEHRKNYELIEAGIPFAEENGDITYDNHHQKIVDMMNDSDPLIKGRGIRLAAEEYGATTKRARRTGWTDSAAAKYAIEINRPISLILTKADALAGINNFSIGRGYDINGIDSPFSRDENIMRNATVHYASYEGYGDIQDIHSYFRIPRGLKIAISDFEKYANANVAVVSTGPKQDQNIIKE